jgi:prophage antirepressor-like protein
MSNTNTLPATFKFGQRAIHVINRNGAPWFQASDLCAALAITNHRDALAKLDDDEKDLHAMPTRGGEQQVTIVSESGMYTLVLRCRDAVKPGTAPHRFRKWVTSEVLPAIRRSGTYATHAATPDVPVLINANQQRELESAVHDLATIAGSRGQNHRAACLKTWRTIRNRFGLSEYVQLPAEHFQDAMDFILDLRTEWEVEAAPDCYTLDDFLSMMHDFYLAGRAPQRVEVELGRQLLMRTKTAIAAARAQLKPAASPADVRAAKQFLSSRALAVTPERWLRSVSFSRETA